jgi:tellurite methyltransferase
MRDWNEIHKTMDVIGPHEKVVGFTEKYLTSDMRVLDHGAGKGRHAVYLAEKGIEVHALDIADTALEVLREKAKKDKLFEKLKVVKGDIKALPFPDEYFDAVISVNVVNHGNWEEVRQYFKEIDRVLRPGGYIMIIGLSTEFLPFVKCDNTREIEPNTYLGFNAPDADIIHYLLTKENIEEILEGYDKIDVGTFPEYSKWLERDVTHLQIIAKKK